ncbi:MAG: hypothetical protein P4L43_07170 [Syntrophobacteraceae bacterium]|nr:hypothetical protein [Syntrophobacteraceae bacterium]
MITSVAKRETNVSQYVSPLLAIALSGAVAVLILPGYINISGYFLYFPTHHAPQTSLEPWRVRDVLAGYCRSVNDPAAVWLFCHGNGGQASERDYFLRCVADDAAVYLLEYPGYGARPGRTSMKSINRAALEALRELQLRYPGKIIGVVGESLGTGPASWLCSQPHPPGRLVLIVPFDNLLSVAREHFPYLPVGWLMRDGRWDNVAALRGYTGPVRIYAAQYDQVIAVHHARLLAAALPRAKYVEMACEHNTWMDGPRVYLSERW